MPPLKEYIFECGEYIQLTIKAYSLDEAKFKLRNIIRFTEDFKLKTK